MAKEVVMVDVEDLGVDTRNIREGKWERNKEFIQDIKENGILNPLNVRPASPESDHKYAIVCGSQRFNAAIEAGLTEVPCFIEEMDDVTALGRTIAENVHQGDVPAWRYAKKIGEMYDELDGEGDRGEIVKIITSNTGFGESTIYTYLNIDQYLPDEIIELMKEPAERSDEVKELVKRSSVTEKGKKLSFDKAAKIASDLKDAPKERKFEVAVSVLTLTKDTAFEAIERAKVYPKESMKKIIEKVKKIPKEMARKISFPPRIWRGLDSAAPQKQMSIKELILHYLKEGLKRDGFL